MRLIPPLNVTGKQINDGVKIFGKALREPIK
jgi:4-aminobutyrate aminotransferase-like enzyme